MALKCKISDVKLSVPKLHVDDRGVLVELLTASQVARRPFGQINICTAKPRAVKANHFHKYKTEYICVISGKAKFTLVDMRTGKKDVLSLSEDKLVIVKIPPNIAHAITNVGGKTLIFIEYSNQVYNKLKPDVVKYMVVKNGT